LFKSLPNASLFAHLFNLCSVWMVPQVKWLFFIIFLSFSAYCKTPVSWLRKILLLIWIIRFCAMKVRQCSWW
jgi:hypothetical protein